MDKPGTNEEIQLVAILRTLKKTHDEVANILKMRKERVGDIEKWLKTAPLDLVERIIDNYRLKSVGENELLKRFEEDEYLGERQIEPVDLVRAGHLTADDILQHYREDYSQEPSIVADLSSLTILDPVASKLYQEHQSGMIRLVETWRHELEPFLYLYGRRSLGGQGINRIKQDHNMPKLDEDYSSLLWQVCRGGSVLLRYRLELAEDTETRIMRSYLEQHLLSSSHSWLIKDDKKGIDKWKRVGGEELKGRTRLLRNIDRAVEKLTNKHLTDSKLLKNAGPSTWFSDSIWWEVLDGFVHTLEYKVGPYGDGLFAAYYGPSSFIGFTPTKEEGEQYVEWHKELMARFKGNKAVKAIGELKEERKSLTKDIQDVLIKFVVDKHIPGKCNYEFCRQW